MPAAHRASGAGGDGVLPLRSGRSARFAGSSEGRQVEYLAFAPAYAGRGAQVVDGGNRAKVVHLRPRCRAAAGMIANACGATSGGCRRRVRCDREHLQRLADPDIHSLRLRLGQRREVGRGPPLQDAARCDRRAPGAVGARRTRDYDGYAVTAPGLHCNVTENRRRRRA